MWICEKTASQAPKVTLKSPRAGCVRKDLEGQLSSELGMGGEKEQRGSLLLFQRTETQLLTVLLRFAGQPCDLSH